LRGRYFLVQKSQHNFFPAKTTGRSENLCEKLKNYLRFFKNIFPFQKDRQNPKPSSICIDPKTLRDFL